MTGAAIERMFVFYRCLGWEKHCHGPTQMKSIAVRAALPAADPSEIVCQRKARRPPYKPIELRGVPW
jgi:hypothetical protein